MPGIDDDGRDLPRDAPQWLPLIVFWPAFDQAAYQSIVACFGEEAGSSWSDFRTWAIESGVAEAVPDVASSAIQVRQEWVPTLEVAVHLLLDEPELRMKVLAGCQPTTNWRLALTFATWARHSHRWELLQQIWWRYVENAADVPGEMLPIFADLPAEARRAYPVLTWISAAAEAETVRPTSRRTEAFLDRLILDSVLLHADWASRESPDAAVMAGILRMVGERYLPPSGKPLDAAWRTKLHLDEFIDERSRSGRPPSQPVISFFRLMSGRMSIMRADLRNALAEAHWGGVLSAEGVDGGLAPAIEALANSLAGLVRPPAELSRVVLRPTDNLRFGSVAQVAEVMDALAYGRECLQLLDRDGVERALAAVPADVAAVAGVWAARVGLETMSAAIWGDPAHGLNRLLSALAAQPIGAREQDEPMGGLMLGRARAHLLCRVGAFGAATKSAESIHEGLRTLPLARTLLWAGRLGPAVRAMELTLPDPDLLLSDRLQLLVIRGAATSLDGSITDDIARDTVDALQQLLVGHSYLAIAMLPPEARQAALELGRELATAPETAEPFAQLRERLAGIAGAEGPSGMVQLTEREAVLLPLLAGGESVPNLAKELHVSVNTLRKQVAVLREKFQASTRSELVRKAGSFGALPSEDFGQGLRDSS
ncbi:regulatory LuxR family protein [Propionicimonas paludicola]|uniref:Regulatory LuxR family protein n=1 Tax=Propionicimonas paludicola TaxID=185243 RepID=A0A2A9CW85_9ACTN|nr:LuxR C-terminal-related transcriptional regulator [Propionicimonas paludicola]PFG18396.1 regulatory LuxR family protein [Propionicimonas paludicola]